MPAKSAFLEGLLTVGLRCIRISIRITETLTYLARINEVHNMGHVLFISDSMAGLADYDVLSINTEQLSDRGSGRVVLLFLFIGLKYMRIVREIVSFQAEVVK